MLQRHFLNFNLICTRNITNNVKNHIEKQAQKHILQNYLGLSYQKTASLLRMHPQLQTIDNKRFEDSVKSLTNMGFSTDDIYNNPMSLSLHYNTIEHNIKYLKEAGFTDVSAQVLLKFRSVVKKPIYLLKDHGVIPENINVPHRLYSYLYPKPDSFQIIDKFNDNHSIVHVHEIIFKHYLIWRLSTTMQEIDRVFKIYDKFKYKSFDLISQMIQILTEDLLFTNEKLLQHGYLFQNGPDFLRQILITFPTLAGVDIKKILFRYPKIIVTPPDNITTIQKHLNDFKIGQEAIQKCFEIFTLAPDTVLYRLNELKKVPQFGVLKNNSRILNLVLYQNKAKMRLEQLEKLKVKCASINLLCASDTVFEKYAQEGNDRTKGSDLINFICQELQIPEKQIRQKLSHNQHWCHVPLTAVQNTLNYLTDNGLPKNDIAFLPIILLYPKEQVKEALRDMEKNKETANLNLSPRERINLCLYFIERKHHFSGDGVWNCKVDSSN